MPRDNHNLRKSRRGDGSVLTDVLIIGGGPAGVTAAVYTVRANFKTTIIYKNYGALEKAEQIGNYYGFSNVSGKSLFEKGLRQARKNGAKTILDEVVNIRKEKDIIIVETPTKIYKSKAVLLATGANRTTPNIPGLSELEGHGVSHCAICDGFFYRNKNVAVLGSDAYALHEANDLIPLVSNITLLTNGEEPSVDFPGSVTVKKEKIREVTGGENEFAFPGLPKQKILKSVILESGEEILISGLFIAIGIAGGTELARKIGAEINLSGSIITDTEMKTSVPGLWAAGDCVSGTKQIAKATHDGMKAGMDICKFLRS